MHHFLMSLALCAASRWWIGVKLLYNTEVSRKVVLVVDMIDMGYNWEAVVVGGLFSL